MSLVSLFSEHFWLLFALAISIAVLRELSLKRDDPALSERRQKRG
ncbi:hypothetical protein [Pseudomonas sp.]|nr:hypothetical protein [Pseudomonas sp.]HUE93653.1 hypothetical protein [Pseudomonas sp.]